MKKSRSKILTLQAPVAVVLLLVLVACSLVGTRVNAFITPSSIKSIYNNKNQYGICHDISKSSCLLTSTRRSHSTSSSTTATALNMFDQLASAISDVTKSFGTKKRMTEESIKPALRDVRRALLDADVNLNVADTLIEGVKQRSIGQEVIKGVTADQQFVKAMYDELLDMMGGDSSKGESDVGTASSSPASTLAYNTETDGPTVVLLAGLQGAGKTTAAGKLALYLKEREIDYDAVDAMDSDEVANLVPSTMPKRQRKVLLVAADIYRPAAIKQLEILAESIDVDVFSMGTEVNPVDIVKDAISKAKEDGYDTVLVDTAGRQVIDDDLMDELRRIKQTVNPDETLLVVDAMTGQEAASLTASFDNAVGITGAILTKMDGDSRGGAAVSVRGVSGKPIKFVGTGEKTPDLEPFYPDRMASRILGMGDVVSLVEKAGSDVSKAEAEEMEKKMREAKFDFNDFMKQAKLVAKMQGIGNVAKMLPGMGNMLDKKQVKDLELRIKKQSAMICSMTKKERADPDLLIKDPTARSRLERITKGSGTSFDDGLQFISEFQRMRTMMARMSKQMGGAGADDMGDPAAMMAGAGGGGAPASGNRAARRAAKKRKKSGRGGGGGFG